MGFSLRRVRVRVRKGVRGKKTVSEASKEETGSKKDESKI